MGGGGPSHIVSSSHNTLQEIIVCCPWSPRAPSGSMNRRTVLATVNALALTMASRSLLAREPPAAEVVTWLKGHAIDIRSVDASDEDFSDLEPIAHAIGGASVVQLGEPSHGAGTALAAKVRLFKFLHQRLGFDVLIWESGLYDVALVQAAMRGTDDAITAARRGIFSLWTEAAEARPVFEYVKSSQATTRPVEMAGFDMQITANGSAERYGPELQAFVDGVWPPPLREKARTLATVATNARRRLFSTGFTARSDVDVLVSASRDLRDLIGGKRSDFEQAWGSSRTDFMDRTVENMRIDAMQRFEAAHSPPTTADRENRRDAVNADNLRWLIGSKCRGRKVVVWAHNVHIMKAYLSGDFLDVHLRPRPGDMKPTGVFLSQWLGRELYTIGMTAFGGSEGLAVAAQRTPIPPAPAGSLEANLHALGHEYAFLDLHSCPPLTARMPKFASVSISDPGRVYDGLFFIDHMKPASPSPA
jgi:erythromycin esterase